MFAVLSCVFEQHDLRLVLVAAVICATACSAAFGFHLRSQKAEQAMRWAWLGLSGLVAGSGVWATHFIAMLAYQPNLPIGYEPLVTAASLVIAVAGMGLGFALPILQRGRIAALAGGALTGLSVAAMHFTGMAAVRAPLRLDWRADYITASVVVGVLGAMAAFQARRSLKGRWEWAGPALLLVLAIVALHFTAMTAVVLTPDPRIAMPAVLVGRGALAIATGALASLIFAACFSLLWMERLGRRSTLRGLREALHAVPSGLAFFDGKGELVAWNRAFAQLMDSCGAPFGVGAARARFVEAAAEAGWRIAGDEDVRAAGAAHLAAGALLPPLELVLPDGRFIRHEAFDTPDGGAATVLTDVTEQRETARILAEARDVAEAANRAKTEFLANMSHEIRTPLNGMLGVAQMLAGTKLSADQRRLVGVLQNSGGLLDTLLCDLLDLAKVEAGVVELRPERTDLGELAQAVCALFTPQAAGKGLALTLELGPGAGGEVDCDPVRLRQVLGNLVSNAVKFTETGKVAVSLVRTGDRVRFEVRDTGVGFDPASKPALFQRFGQGDGGPTRRHGGAGLGLAISDEFVRMMGGELDCESRPGEGSVFTFELPLPAQGAAAEHDAGPQEDRPMTPFRVLVVDDNAVNRQVLQLILESAGLAHEMAEDGRQAVEAVERGAFDAILMDIQMPVMDGLEATRRIRAWEHEAGRPRTPLYIVSANGLAEHVAAGRAAGADGHFNKPVVVAELLAALQPHIRAAAARAA
jgi:signal transduction histidine kinase/NO-binding membrane sensor protein with MHYT domain/CheY-like chemotaxis protein